MNKWNSCSCLFEVRFHYQRMTQTYWTFINLFIAAVNILMLAAPDFLTIFWFYSISTPAKFDRPIQWVSSCVATFSDFSHHFGESSWMVSANLSKVGSRNTSDGGAFSIHATAQAKCIKNHLRTKGECAIHSITFRTNHICLIEPNVCSLVPCIWHIRGPNHVYQRHYWYS